MGSIFDDILKELRDVPQDRKDELARQFLSQRGDLEREAMIWKPLPGPQSEAYYSDADVLLYGGQAGGGKSGLLGGLALTAHKRSLLMRRQYTDIKGLIEDILEKYGTRRGFSGSPPAKLRTNDGRMIDFGGAKTPGDEAAWKGNPHDFLGVDEVTQFLESQVRFLMGWVRSADETQRCRTVFATNPPEDPAVGQWVIDMFAPWLDPTYHDPAQPGELRWVVTDENGEDMWVDGPEPFKLAGQKVTPQSRTFIPSSLDDNPFLRDTTYKAQLDSLPEPLRSAIRDGNWTISHEDNPWQMIPTNWILAAQERWSSNIPDVPMCAMGVDIAQGGSNDTVIAPRYDTWFAPLIVVPGRETPEGRDVAALVFKHRRNNAVVVPDVGGGYAGALITHLEDNGITRDSRMLQPFNGANGTAVRTADRQLGFVNVRAAAYWGLREALDPDQEGGSPIMLPPDPALRADLTATRYKLTARGIQAEMKEDIIDRLGRSPDRGDAVVMAWYGGPTYLTHQTMWRKATAMHGPGTRKVNRGHEAKRRRR